MRLHAKQSATPGGGPCRPEPPWVAAAIIGVGINILAASVIALSVGVAISTAIVRAE